MPSHTQQELDADLDLDLPPWPSAQPQPQQRVTVAARPRRSGSCMRAGITSKQASASSLRDDGKVNGITTSPSTRTTRSTRTTTTTTTTISSALKSSTTKATIAPVPTSRSRPPPTSTLPHAPIPRTFFSPWNSSSTGHQRAENRLRGSTSWRESRAAKLAVQYRAGLDGGKRVADTVGEGSEGFGKDGRKANGGWERGGAGLRGTAQKSLVEVWAMSKGKRKHQSLAEEDGQTSKKMKTGNEQVGVGVGGRKMPQLKEDDIEVAVIESDQAAHIPHLDSDTKHEDKPESTIQPQPQPQTKLFSGLVFYLNGSTGPLVSDHKLKQLIASHGGTLSISLGRRTVTHVVLGTANGLQGRGHIGAGGGLAASKMHKEIVKKGGKSVRFVKAEWVIESIKATRRLPESRFAPLKLAPSKTDSVRDFFGKELPG